MIFEVTLPTVLIMLTIGSIHRNNITAPIGMPTAAKTVERPISTAPGHPGSVKETMNSDMNIESMVSVSNAMPQVRAINTVTMAI